jgi:hypothetical protein
VLAERIGNSSATFVQRTHQVDSTPRRIHLAAKHAICRTRGKTQTAVNTIEVKLILRRRGGQG